jgi:MBG domain-containing protein/HYR domain-containing protein/type IX secretion system substrate protein
MISDDPGVFDSPPSMYTQASPSRPAGDYPIQMAGGIDNNYMFALYAGTVTILEHTAPVISNMPSDITALADQGFAHAIVFWTEPRASDNVGVTSFTSDHASGDAFPMGTTMVSYTATDAAGNQASASFTITVNKNDPVITWISPETISYGTALGASQLNASSAVAGTFSYNPPEGVILNVNNMQTLSVSFVPDDPSASNSTSASTTIDVAKTMLTATAENKSINQGEEIPELTLSYSGFVNGENQEALFFTPTLSTTATPESPAGDYVISVAGGTDSNYAFTLLPGTLTILDITNPVFSNIPSNITLFADEGVSSTTVSWTPPTVTDNVGVTHNASNHSPGETFPVGTTTISYIAFDAAGNQSWASFTITINKNDPVITWITPNTISYGTALGASQLNASSSVSGIYSYDPSEGTLLDAGNAQTLNVSFVPDNPEAFNSVSASTTIDVNKATLTATVENKSINQGEEIPELTLSYSGFVNSEDQKVIDTPPTLATTATTQSEAGDYAISITGGSDHNYELTLEPGTLTILSSTHVGTQNQINCTVYPNPASEGIRIKGVDDIATFTLYTINGSALINCKIEDNAYIPLTGLNPGLYLVDIQSQTGYYRTKIVKSRQ